MHPNRKRVVYLEHCCNHLTNTISILLDMGCECVDVITFGCQTLGVDLVPPKGGSTKKRQAMNACLCGLIASERSGFRIDGDDHSHLLF